MNLLCFIQQNVLLFRLVNNI